MWGPTTQPAVQDDGAVLETPAGYNFPQFKTRESALGWDRLIEAAACINFQPHDIVEMFWPLNSHWRQERVAVIINKSYTLSSILDLLRAIQRLESYPAVFGKYGAVAHYVSAAWIKDVLEVSRSCSSVRVVKDRVSVKDFPRGEITWKSDPQVQALMNRLGGPIFDYENLGGKLYKFVVGVPRT